MKYFPKIVTTVTVSDMTDIMRCTFISNHVVDAFAELLNRAYNMKLDALILPGHCWLDHEKLYQTITDRIPCVREGIIFFSIVSPGVKDCSTEPFDAARLRLRPKEMSILQLESSQGESEIHLLNECIGIEGKSRNQREPKTYESGEVWFPDT